MEEIDCILCDRSSHDIVIEEDGYTGRRCPECELIYVSPRPTEQEIPELYENYQTEDPAGDFSSDVWKKRIVNEHTLRIIRRWKKSGSLLEVGAGKGSFLYNAREAGYEVRGTELDATAADFIENGLGIPCENSPLRTSLFGDKRFDVIYHRNVLSHFHDPISELETMNSLLKEDGILVFETGNFGEMDEKYYKYIPRFQYPDHLFFFSENNIKNMLDRTGFETISVNKYSRLPWLRVRKVLKLVNEFISIDFLRSTVKSALKNDEDANSSSPTRRKESNSSSSRKQSLRRTFTEKLARTLYYFYSSFWNFARFSSIYKLGDKIPNEGHPQTMIVVARKKN